MLNVVALMGRLVADPELKTTQSGNSVCTFRVAVDRSYAPQGEERQADFITVTAWRKTAEFICKYFQKGSMISVQGRLETRQYQDKPATASYEKQTANHVREANAAHSAPQQPQSYAQGGADDFAEISDADDLPF